MSITLPDDVVAIDTGKKSLMFYVYPNADNNNILSYLESPNDKGTGDFAVRVYYVAKGTNFIRELCKTGDGDWFVGALSAKGETFKIRRGTSISASVHAE
ncbi:hypothetical protein BFJ67_g9093 [Fusarium oxysporum f. sp. cepae]|nr:hypothetical protein BFJ67_g9093 [Fusarium oxysporum f. sp. cepae]